MKSKRPRILLVDDNQAIHETLELSLGESSLELIEGSNKDPENPPMVFDIHHAYSGEEAMAKNEMALRDDFPYSVVVLDMRMPKGMDGLETMKRMKAMDPKLQFVICSGYQDYDLEEFWEAFPDKRGYLIMVKPFDKTVLRQMLVNLYEKWVMDKKYAILKKREYYLLVGGFIFVLLFFCYLYYMLYYAPK